MNTKQVCETFSVTPKMLRIYEENGLLCPTRCDNNYRTYSSSDLLQLQAVVVLRRLEFSIAEIKAILKHKKSKWEYLDIFYLQMKATELHIENLKKTKEELRNSINQILKEDDIGNIVDNIIENNQNKSLHSVSYNALIKQWNFDEMASNYVNRYLKEDISYKTAIDFVRNMITRMGKNQRIIDIGCGICNLWQNFDTEYDLTAVDNSLLMLEESKFKISWLNTKLDDLITMDTEEYGQFDIVISTFLMHHIDRIHHQAAIDNLLRLCKEDGVIIIADRSFMNHKQRIAVERELLEKGEMEKLEMIKSEYFLYVEEINKYLPYKGYTIDCKHIMEHVYCYIIKKPEGESS